MAKEERSKPLVLAQFLEGLTQSSGSATLLLHHQQDTRWMILRERLEFLKNLTVLTSVDPFMKPKKPMGA